jgi:hypothetical protein
VFVTEGILLAGGDILFPGIVELAIQEPVAAEDGPGTGLEGHRAHGVKE